ncbi:MULTISPECIES: hypothetical protein [Proteus]|uniref:hypothetical protein n=1 Tax=Proteus terrae TaxID=1574161 RepID=UPI001BA883E3|nr:hypothetical protein [Proteus terrae]QUT01941.1 hypothetical protein KF949_00370 [Proteus terrae subsp. cibarius]
MKVIAPLEMRLDSVVMELDNLVKVNCITVEQLICCDEIIREKYKKISEIIEVSSKDNNAR